jgi:hypothetical protein
MPTNAMSLPITRIVPISCIAQNFRVQQHTTLIIIGFSAVAGQLLNWPRRLKLQIIACGAGLF